MSMKVGLRLLVIPIATLLVVTGLGIPLDRALFNEGVPRQDLVLLSDLLVGLVAAALAYVVAISYQRRAQFIKSQLEIIEQMNHHIRNALQVISYQTWSSHDRREVATIEE